MNPLAEWQTPSPQRDAAQRRGPEYDQRFPHCDWAPSPQGTHLTWQGGDKSNSASREIRYLIDHFLKPGAKASHDGRPDFEPFTFDHVVNGIIAAYRDDGRLYLILVDANEVRETTLVDGASGW